MVGVHVPSSYDHPVLGGGTREENRFNHSLAPANFRQKASCVSQKRHPSSHFVLLRPGHPMSTHHHVHHTLATTYEYLARQIRTTIQGGTVVRSPCGWARRSDHKSKQIVEDTESKIWATGFLTRLYSGHVLDWARRKSSRVAQCDKCGCSYLEMKSALSASEIHRNGGTRMQSGLSLFPSKVATTTSSEIQRYSTQLGAVDVTHRRSERGPGHSTSSH
jgi:hypothetical protein